MNEKSKKAAVHQRAMFPLNVWRSFGFAAVVLLAVMWCTVSADAAVSIVATNQSTVSGSGTTGFNLTIPSGQTANCVVVIVHCESSTNLATENVTVTVGGASAPSVNGGMILHNGTDADVELETFCRTGTWTAGTIAINWAWVGTAPTNSVVGAFAFSGVYGVDWPFQSVKFRSDPINNNARSVVMPSMSTAINGTKVIWAYASDSATAVTASASPALSSTTAAWSLSGTGFRAQCWYGTVADANDAEVLGVSDGRSRVVLVGLAPLPIPPLVTSVTRASANPTGASTVDYLVTFSQSVTGVDASDFAVTASGVTGASVASVTGSGATRTVTVNTGSGSGTIRLDVADNDTIINTETNPLGGPGTNVTGNGSYIGGDVYTIDRTPPTVLSVDCADDNPTNADTVTFFVNFSEFVTGVSNNDFSVVTSSGITGASVVSVWPSGSGAWRLVTVASGSGSGTLQLNVLADGSIMDTLSTPMVTPFTSGSTYTIDKVPPTGSLSIDGGQYPPSDVVTLTLSALDANGVVGMHFSNDNLLWSVEEPYATSKTWTLSPDDGLKTVYVQYKDALGNWSSSPITDQVVRDTTPPTGTVTVGTNGFVNSVDVTLTLSASDANGVKMMRFSNDNANWSADEIYATSKDWTLMAGGDGPRTLYVQYEDDAGNWCDPIQTDLTLDTLPPSIATASILINSGNAYTTLPSVTLTLSASDENGIFSMRFSNDNTSWGSEQAYDAAAGYTLPSGDGTKTVYAQFRDFAGNWSSSISDSIILDMTPPTKPVMTAVPPTIDQTPTWSWTSGGGGNGTYRIDLDYSGTWSETALTTFTPADNLLEGNHRLVVQERDNAGNWSASASWEIFVDLTDPLLTVNALGLTNDITPIFSGSVSDNMAVASVEVAVVDGYTYTAVISGGTWHAQVPDSQALVGAPPTSYVADVTATDYAGRTTTQRTYFAVDSTVPTVVNYISTADATFTNATQVHFDVVFSLGVRWVSASDFSLYTTGLTGAAIVNVSGIADSDTWSVTVSTGSGEGTIRLDVADQDTIIDVYNHPLGGIGIGNGDYSSGGAYTIDRTPPVVSLTSTASSPNNLAAIPIVLTFGESLPTMYHGLPNFTSDDVVLENATMSDFEMVSADEYHFNAVPSADGAVTVHVPADGVVDEAGNGNTASNTLSFVSDRTAPVATVTAVGSATNISPVVFTINFSEPVTGLTTSGISVLGGTKGSLSGSGSGPYTLPVTSATDGTITCQVLAGAVHDASLNTNEASAATSVRLDRTAPKPTVTGPASPSNAFPIAFTITFDEAVSGLTADGITVTNGTKATFSGADAGPYTLLVYPDADGPVTCQVGAGAATDAAGNSSVASNTLTVVSKRAALSVSISAPSSAVTRSGPVSYTVAYGDATTITLQAADITLNTTGSAVGVLHVSGSGALERTVTIDGIAGTGTLGITIAGGTAFDSAGNLAEAKGPSVPFTVDNTPPSVTVTPLGTTNNATPTLSGTATDNVAVSGVGVTVNGVTYAAHVNDVWWNAKVTVPLADGDYTANIVATDTVGNTASLLSAFTVDENAPTKVEAITLSGASPTNADTVAFQIVFSDSVAAVVLADLALHTTGTIADASIAGITGAGNTRTVTVNTGTGEGTIRLDVVDRDTILDSRSNPLGGLGLGNGDFTSGQAYTIDRTIPYPTITVMSPNPTGIDTIDFRVVFSEIVTPTFDASKVTLTGSLTGYVSVTGMDRIFTVSVVLTQPDVDGTLAISVGDGLADTAGTPCAVATSPVCNVYNWFLPRFTTQPASVRVYTGDTPTFTLAANCGASTMSYQWKWLSADTKTGAKGVVHNVGGNYPTYSITDATSGEAGDYWCEVTYDGVTHASATATLEVASPIEVTGPYNVTAPVDGQATFSVTATGGYPPLSYAWKKSGGSETLSTTQSLVFDKVATSDAGDYQVEVSDSNGTVITKTTQLKVTEAGLPVVGTLGLGMLLSGLVLGGSLVIRRKK